MTRHATVAGEAKRRASEKLRSLGYKVDPMITVMDVCDIIKRHTGRHFTHDMVPYMVRFANECEGTRATSRDWNCIDRRAYTMDRGMEIAARRARESL